MPSSASIFDDWRVRQAFDEGYRAVLGPSALAVSLPPWALLFAGFAGHYRRLIALPRRTRRAMSHRWRCTLPAIALWLALGQAPAWAEVIDVTPGTPPVIKADGRCSLAEAIVNANRDRRAHLDCVAGAGADTIVLPANSVHRLNAAQELPRVDSRIAIQGRRSSVRRNTVVESYLPLLRVGATGDLTLDKLTISGATSADVAGGHGIWNDGGTVTLVDSRVEDANTGIVNSGGTMVLRRSVVTGSGLTQDIGEGGGGAIGNYGGTLVLTDSTVTGNSSVFGPGGIFNSGVATIVDSRISDNFISYEGVGGGIENRGTLVLMGSTVSGNTADIGAGITTTGRATLIDSTISGNRITGVYSYGGAGILAAGTTTIDNCTVSGNRGDLGSGLYLVGGALTLTHSTVTGNSAEYAGGGVYVTSGRFTARRSIIAGNSADYSPAGREVRVGHYAERVEVVVDDHNVFGHDGDAGVSGFVPGSTDIVPGRPLSGILLPLADNGGGTRTHALAIGSPALDASPYDARCPRTDQRGNPRPRGPACDVGAFEGVAVRCNGLVTTMVGTVGPDRLTGTSGRDVIGGLSGDDEISGLGGDDIVCGGLGADLLRGGPGRDLLFGEPGNDRLFGDGGDDALVGGTDRDLCDGGAHAASGDTAATCETVRNVP